MRNGVETRINEDKWRFAYVEENRLINKSICLQKSEDN